jgi:hypothetical protein
MWVKNGVTSLEAAVSVGRLEQVAIKTNTHIDRQHLSVKKQNALNGNKKQRRRNKNI